MASSIEAAYKCHRHAQPEASDDHGGATPFSRRSFRQNSSLPSSSSSSSFSSNASLNGPDDSPMMSPCPARFSGVPFSWEWIPGKPKNNDQVPKKEDLLLPLPPSSNHSSFRKSSKEVAAAVPDAAVSPRRDPFLAALVKCSKDDLHRRGDVIGRYWRGQSKAVEKSALSLSDRFGFVNVYASCKRTCAVSESIVFLPRSRRCDLISRR